MRRLLRIDRRRNEEGQALILVGVMLALMVGVAAVVIDGSNAFVQRQSLQNAADAAALAAAQELSTSGCPGSGTCGTEAATYASDNNAFSTPLASLFPC